MSTATEMQRATYPLNEPVEAAIGDTPYRFTADAFLASIEAGRFTDEGRIYLRDGRIYEKMAKTDAHSVLGSHIVTSLIRRLPPHWSVFPGGQFKVNEINSRLPDVAVARGGDPRAFLAPGAFPQASDLALIVEIAVTSLAKELGANLERYARALVPNYWVADFSNRQLLAHTQPHILDGRGVYDQTVILIPGGRLTLFVDGQEVAQFAYEDLMP
jgi:hypothetical protein